MKRKKIKQWVVGLSILALTIVFIMPYLHLFFSSFKKSSEIFSTPPTFFPDEFTFENYLNINESHPFGRYFFNSIITAIIGTAMSVLLGSMAAYGISRFKVKLNNYLLFFALVARMIPYISIAIPIYKGVANLGFTDTKSALAVVYIGMNLPFVIWLMTGFFDSIPLELDEAARVDGCSRVKAFFKVILPVALPGLASTSIFSFMFSWNDFLFALLLTRTQAKTVPVGISQFLTLYNSQWGTLCAAAILFSLPVLLITYLIQKRIVAGLTLGSVKG